MLMGKTKLKIILVGSLVISNIAKIGSIDLEIIFNSGYIISRASLSFSTASIEFSEGSSNKRPRNVSFVMMSQLILSALINARYRTKYTIVRFAIRMHPYAAHINKIGIK